LHADCSL